MSSERDQLDMEWAQLRSERAQFENERAAFEEERLRSGVEVKLFVGNLGPSSDDVKVKALFDQYGTVKEVHVLRDREGNSKRSCFVKFFVASDADKAVAALDGKHKDDDSRDYLAVRRANVAAKAAMMGASPHHQQHHHHHQPQQPQQGGGVYGDNYQTGNQGYSGYGQGGQLGGQPGWPGNGYGIMGPGSSVVGGGTVNGLGRGQGGGAPVSRGPAGANLYINNLSAATSQYDLDAMFGDFGKVVSLKLFPTPNGLSYGFVSYENAPSAQAAIASLNGLDMGAATGGSRRTLEVRIKADKGVSNTGRFSPY